MNGNRKAKPTARDLRAAKELKRRWLAIPRDLRPTQDQLGERYGEGGSQSLISQYMNGNIPLNPLAIMFFARELNCSPDDIYPNHPGVAPFTGLYRTMTGLEYPKGVSDVQFAGHGAYSDPADKEWQSFTPEQKRDILALVRQAAALKPTAKARKPK